MSPIIDSMGNLLTVVKRAWAHRNLHRGNCEGCGAIFPDNHPKGRAACCVECAEEAWLARQ